MKIRVMLADDHVSLCETMKPVVEQEREIEVVGMAHSGRRAIELARELKPDVVVLDVTMPDLSGMDALREIRKLCPNVEAVMFSMHNSAEYISQSLKAGAKSYLLKEETVQHLVQAVYAVHAGRRYFTKKVKEKAGFVLDHSPSSDCKSPIESLSALERQIVSLVADGKTSSQIATKLPRLKATSIDTYRSRIYRKLGVSSVAELTKVAIQHGLTRPA